MSKTIKNQPDYSILAARVEKLEGEFFAVREFSLPGQPPGVTQQIALFINEIERQRDYYKNAARDTATVRDSIRRDRDEMVVLVADLQKQLSVLEKRLSRNKTLKKKRTKRTR